MALHRQTDQNVLWRSESDAHNNWTVCSDGALHLQAVKFVPECTLWRLEWLAYVIDSKFIPMSDEIERETVPGCNRGDLSLGCLPCAQLESILHEQTLCNHVDVYTTA